MVYIKNHSNPSLYKQPSEIMVKSNQKFFRKNSLEELLNNQDKVNKSLDKSTKEVNSILNETKFEQFQQFNHLVRQLEEQEKRTTPLIENLDTQQKVYDMFLIRLNKLEQLHHELVQKHDDKEVIHQAMMDQLTIQDHALQKMSKNIETYTDLHKDLNNQINTQHKTNEEILKSLELQEAFHQTVLEKLDQQDALNRKTANELDTLKSTLYERINYVIEKIEDNYKSIITYFGKLFKKDKSAVRMEEEKQKETVGSK
ncbi:vacuolar-type H+-ATPase subunit I/STV1 [Metabacillus crassostreae]|uniref:hypothetical protein n=1 Tax=Metabacillus crassostreae TaxID=929098 RepID=UPI00195CDB48|nr:hypothetical protein [Metabacillus crassostreae]MBM7602193.1 vacuolar-type H+-ATPase subunit I/STV1 [Metabacillus crassostreae]